MRIVLEEVAGASEAFRLYWDRELEAAAVHDQLVLPVKEKGRRRFRASDGISYSRV